FGYAELELLDIGRSPAYRKSKLSLRVLEPRKEIFDLKKKKEEGVVFRDKNNNEFENRFWMAHLLMDYAFIRVMEPERLHHAMKLSIFVDENNTCNNVLWGVSSFSDFAARTAGGYSMYGSQSCPALSPGKVAREGDPEDHVKIFQAAAQVERWAMPTWCHMFNSTLIRTARIWFDELPSESIDGYKDLKAAFLSYFMQQKKYVKDLVEIHNIKQKDEETIEDFMKRFKTIEEMMIATVAFIRGETAGASKKKVHTPWKSQDQSKRQNSERRSNFRNQPRDERGSNKFTPLTRTPKDIFTAELEKFKPPPPMVTPVKKTSNNKFYEFHNDKGHSNDECVQLRKLIEELKVIQSFAHVKEIKFPPLAANKETEGPLVIEAEISGHTVHRIYVDGGSSMEPGIREIQSVPSTAHGMLKFPMKGGIVTIRSTILMPTECTTIEATPKDQAKKAEIRHKIFKVAIHPDFPDQEITIGGTVSIKAQTELCTLLKRNLDIFAWQPSNMTRVEKSLPLFKTLKKCIKNSDFHWTPDAKHAFKQLKQQLERQPMLVAPKPKEELIMYLSASYGAISAVLMTKRDTLQTPVYFVRYFQAHPIMVIIDQPIKQVMSCPDVARRLQKWSVMQGEHNITYRPRTSAKGQILADFLVKKPDDTSPEASMGVRNVHVSVDSKLVANQVLGTYVAKEENIVKYLEKAKSLMSGFANLSISQVPRSKNEKADALSKIASTNFAHLSKQVLVEVLKEKSIQEEEVATLVEEEGPTWMTPIMKYLKDGTLLSDRKEASKLRPGKVKFLIVAIDYFTKWIETKAVATITGSQVKKFVWDNIVCRFGLPGEIVSDNVKHSQSNGLVERANRSLCKGIKARLDEGNKNWIEELPHVLWAHRTMINPSHGETPFSLTYGTKAVMAVEIRMPTYRTAVVDTVHNNEELRLNLDLLEEQRECVAIREAKEKLKMIKFYNTRVRGVTFRPGDFVYRSNETSHAMDGGKLGSKWEGPYEVTEALRDGAYRLSFTDGTVLPRTYNVDNIKKCYI
nr:reverse transcriptase domain-containing protein [Tanacetum cinerariifolium]